MSDQITRVRFDAVARCGKIYEISVAFSDRAGTDHAMMILRRALQKLDKAAGKRREES